MSSRGHQGIAGAPSSKGVEFPACLCYLEGEEVLFS